MEDPAPGEPQRYTERNDRKNAAKGVLKGCSREGACPMQKALLRL